MRRGARALRRLLALAALLGCAAACVRAGGPARASAPPPAAAPASYDLGRDERAGGHTLARHVGRTDRELADRLRRERHIAAASSYADRATAESVVGETLARGRARVDAWLAREGRRPNLALDYRGDPGRPVGRLLRRGEAASEPAWNAVVVLEWAGPGSFFVLTSYPEGSR